IRTFRRELKPIGSRFLAKSRLRDGPAINWPFFGERMRGNFRGDVPVIQNFRDAAFGDFADDDRVEPPLSENVEDFALAAFSATSSMRSCDSLSIISYGV